MNKQIVYSIGRKWAKTMDTKVVTNEFAIKIDTELADLHNKKWAIQSDIFLYIQDIASVRKSRYYNDSDRERTIQNYQLKVAKLEMDLQPILQRISELNEIYVQYKWTRAFLVINSNGHIHSSMDCSTCFDSTRYEWLVNYSNHDEDEIVGLAGEKACTICYPTAPAEVLNRPCAIVSKDKQAKELARIAREEKRAIKLAKEKANAPTKSGEPLRVPSYVTRDGVTRYQTLNTERSAITEWLNNASWSTNDSIRATANQLIVEALAEKHGITIEEQTAILNKKLKGRK